MNLKGSPGSGNWPYGDVNSHPDGVFAAVVMVLRTDSWQIKHAATKIKAKPQTRCPFPLLRSSGLGNFDDDSIKKGLDIMMAAVSNGENTGQTELPCC